ncbi:hypothetical protein Fmac_010137 [Flemingia macrophylla]|uniref:NB-ARC domain-containing protein n=1 Tax=Flemingia macrophylla TaxID=520843 RepID=A0ABD1N339_9FABA
MQCSDHSRNHPYDRDEADLIDDIVKDVLNQLSLRHPKKCKGLVGIEKSYEDIKLSLNIGLEEVKTLGIWGMGGIGKTTLATTLYEELSSEFEGSCYLANVRAKSEKLEDLREELFSKLLGKNHSYETFRNKRVFIVLDDVATEKQLEELIYRFDYLGPGKSLPSNFCAELVELHMRKSKLKNLDGLKVLKNLKVIDLQRSEDLIDIQGLSKAKKLECVNLNFCRKIERLNIHSTYLRQLDVLCCSSLKEISVGLVELRELKLSGNSKLERLKVHSKYISELDLTGVSSLKELDLSNCSSLEEILVSSEEITKLLLSDTRAYASLSWIGNLLSLEELDLSRSNVESLPENINSFQKMRELTLKGNNELVSLPELPPYLRVLQIDDCMNLESLPELPVTLQTLSAFNCISLEIERSRSLVLEHMSQRWIPFLHQHPLNLLVRDYFVLPVKPVTDEHVFDTTESSISIPGLKMSDLSGFIYCIILSQGLLSHSMLVSIYQDDILLCDSRDGWNDEYASCRNQTQDHHAMFWYHDIKIYDGTSVVYDNSKDITFKFKIDENQQSIKRFNVTPVYV